jgi:hypothetical protein
VHVAYQRVIREREANRSPLASLDGSTIRAIDHTMAAPIVLRYEWLGTVAPIRVASYGLFAPDGELLGVVQFAKMPREPNNVCGVEYASKAICLARGACVPHAPKNAASYLISRAVRLAHAEHGWSIFFAYADESARELGSIYQACNWHYLGQGLGRAPGRARENFRTPGGRVVWAMGTDGRKRPPSPPRSEAPRRSRGAPRIRDAVLRSVHDEAAVDAQRLAGHVAGLAGDQEADHVRDVLRTLHAPQRHL